MKNACKVRKKISNFAHSKSEKVKNGKENQYINSNDL